MPLNSHGDLNRTKDVGKTKQEDKNGWRSCPVIARNKQSYYSVCSYNNNVTVPPHEDLKRKERLVDPTSDVGEICHVFLIELISIEVLSLIFFWVENFDAR